MKPGPDRTKSPWICNRPRCRLPCGARLIGFRDIKQFDKMTEMFELCITAELGLYKASRGVFFPCIGFFFFFCCIFSHQRRPYGPPSKKQLLLKGIPTEFLRKHITTRLDPLHPFPSGSTHPLNVVAIDQEFHMVHYLIMEAHGKLMINKF